VAPITPPPDPVSLTTLARLLGDRALAEFRQAWPHRSWLLPADAERARALSTLLPLDLKALLRAAPWKQIRLFAPSAEGRLVNCLVTPRQAWALFGPGVTLEIYHLERFLPQLGQLARALEDELEVERGRCHVQAFASRGGMGFPLHFDKSEVLTIQLAGRKRWWFAGPEVRYPTCGYESGKPIIGELGEYWPRQSAVSPAHRPADEREVVLEPGAVIHLPRGHWHRTETLDPGSLSLSLTFVVSTQTFAERALEELRRRLLRSAEWRATCVPSATDRAHARELLASLGRLAGSIDADDLLAVTPITKEGQDL